MKGKLSKNRDGGYTLSHHPSGWGIGSTDHEWVASHKGEQIVSKLSLKNCQAIEEQESNQTEWEVIVEMEDIQEIHIDGVLTLQPKLDADGCLILKLKSEKELTLIVIKATLTDEQLNVLVSEIKTVAEYIGIELNIKQQAHQKLKSE